MFEEIIKKLREEKQVSRFRMCKDLGISYQGMYYIEYKGGSRETQEKIANYFGKTVEEVFPGKDTYKDIKE